MQIARNGKSMSKIAGIAAEEAGEVRLEGFGARGGDGVRVSVGFCCNMAAQGSS